MHLTRNALGAALFHALPTRQGMASDNMLISAAINVFKGILAHVVYCYVQSLVC